MIVAVKHNIEVAHRLSLLPGKCENIHGHSMWVTLELEALMGQYDIAENLEFGAVKKDFRNYLDTEFDHHLLLNAVDPFLSEASSKDLDVPGVKICPGDPTTENIAYWIGSQMSDQGYPVASVTVWETAVNMAKWVVPA